MGYPGTPTLTAAVASFQPLWAFCTTATGRLAIQLRPLLADAFACLDAACCCTRSASKQQPCLPPAADVHCELDESPADSGCTAADSAPYVDHQFKAESRTEDIGARDVYTTPNFPGEKLQLSLTMALHDGVIVALVQTAGPDAPSAGDLGLDLQQNVLALLVRLLGSVCPTAQLPTFAQQLRELGLLRWACHASARARIRRVVAAFLCTWANAVAPTTAPPPPSPEDVAEICGDPLRAIASRITFEHVAACRMQGSARLPGPIGTALAVLALDTGAWANADEETDADVVMATETGANTSWL